MKKAIVIIRTSTKAQEIEAQKKEVLAWAMSDGYTMDEIAIVGQQGASAIKLDAAYLENLKRVYDTINTNPIECIYAWAIDRIGRKETILMELKNLLIEKGINLKVMNPSLTLLNADGTVNSGVELAFSLFATMAKQEMEQKQARFARAKKQNKELGKYNGGGVQWGYKVENNYIVPSEEADKVRSIFELYASGKYSAAKLAKELNARGWKHNNKFFSERFIATTLKNELYLGGTTKANTYPAIVSEEIWNKCAEVRKNLTITPIKTKESKHIHLALGLLKCKECGRNYTTTAGGASYVCILHAKKYLHNETCSNNTMISTKLLDTVLWKFTKNLIFMDVWKGLQMSDAEIKEKVGIAQEKIEAAMLEIEKANERKEDLNVRFYVEGVINEKEYKRYSAMIDNTITKKNEEIKLNEADIERYKGMNKPIDRNEVVKYIRDYSDTDKKETITKVWENITISRMKVGGKTITYVTLIERPTGAIRTLAIERCGSYGSFAYDVDGIWGRRIQTKKATR